jgi:hypothetical protein
VTPQAFGDLIVPNETIWVRVKAHASEDIRSPRGGNPFVCAKIQQWAGRRWASPCTIA